MNHTFVGPACFPINTIAMRWDNSNKAVDPVAMKNLNIGDIVKVRLDILFPLHNELQLYPSAIC